MNDTGALYALFKCTPQLSKGISYTGKSKYRVVEAVTGTSAAVNILTKYVARFGTLVAGSNIGISVEVVDPVTGFKGIASTLLANVAA